MGAADGSKGFLAGFEAQVVGVVQAEGAACLLELGGGETFEGCLGGDGHEYGEGNRAVWKNHV